MRVVLDTNIFISGIFWKGNSYKTLELWKNERFILITSMGIISEFVRVLRDFKIRLPESIIREWLDLIVKNSLIVEPKERIKVVKDDSSDDMFVEAADAGKADYIVSQDKHLLKLKQVRGIKIVLPEQFIKICK